MSLPIRRPAYICHQCQFLVRQQRRAYAIKKDKKIYLPTTPARTRFAPSPTGYLHFGSLRTALYNYLLAKRTKGQFILRLEDTDEKRTIPDAEERIYRDLEWAGLEWDEGPQVGGKYGPYRQSERLDLYRSSANTLIQSGAAYRCFCSPSTLRQKDEANLQKGHSTGYDRTCYHNITPSQSEDYASQGKPHVIRLLDREDSKIEGEDFVYGKIPAAQKRIGQTFDDPILLKQSGGATYHLANVVDDHYMQITHVIRGVEWLISTRKHLTLYKAFDWTPPTFAHVGLLLDTAGNKLSKRDLSFNLETLKTNGILPEALNNFLVLLGWSHREGKEFMSMEKLESIFDLRFTKSNPVVSLGKLDYLVPFHAERRVKEAATAGRVSSLGLTPGAVSTTKVLSKQDSTLQDVSNSSDPANQRLDTLIDLISAAATRKYSPESLASLGLNNPAKLRLRAEQMLEDYYRNYTNAVDFVSSSPYLFVRDNPNGAATLKLPMTSTKLLRVSAQDLATDLRKELERALEDLSPSLSPDAENHWIVRDIESQLKSVISGQVAALLARLDAPESESSLQKLAKPELNALLWKILRGILTWGMHGPSLASTMVMLGSEETLRRVRENEVRFEKECEGGLSVEAS